MIASRKLKAIQLKDAEVTTESKGREPVMKISIPHAPSLLLKAKNQKEFNVWFSNIQVSVVNSKARATFKQLDKLVRKLENCVARTDRREVTATFSSTESALRTEERRAALFDGLSRFRPECKCLADLYNQILLFSTMQRLGKAGSAIACAKEIYRMVTEFRFEGSERLEAEVRSLIQSVASKEIVQEIEKGIKECEASNSVHEIFNPLIQSIMNTIDTIRNEIAGKARMALTTQDLKLMAVPISLYKKSINWSMPVMLTDLKVLHANIAAYKQYKSTELMKNLGLSKLKLMKPGTVKSRNEQAGYMNGYRTHREPNVILDM